MSGFAAYLGPLAAAQARLAKRMAGRLHYRGPDGAGDVSFRDTVLSHQRLAIIDMTRGGQPMLNEDGRIALVCNGEIYNHVELRDRLLARHIFKSACDSEVIVHLFEDKGASCVQYLDGMFAFVVSDGKRFIAARDPFGIKPLYLGRDNVLGTWFASELKAIPTICSSIIEIPPGSMITERGVSYQWFVPEWKACRHDDCPSDPGKLAEQLDRAVGKRLMSDVPIGVFLSGGIDSSIIAALMRRHVPGLMSFSVGMEDAPDLHAARQVAAHLGTQHHELVYTQDDIARVLETVIGHLESYDPALVRAAMPSYFLSKLAADYAKVVLTGDGADEVFAGYEHVKGIADAAELHSECVRGLYAMHNTNLQRLDRMTMAHGLEGRVPFLDTGFLDWAMALDPAEKMHRLERPEKWLLRCAFADQLPESIVWRSRMDIADGAGGAKALQQCAERGVSDADFARAARLFPRDTPTSKEAFRYRRIFEVLFPGELRRRTVGKLRHPSRPMNQWPAGDVH